MYKKYFSKLFNSKAFFMITDYRTYFTKVFDGEQKFTKLANSPLGVLNSWLFLQQNKLNSQIDS